MKMELTVSQLSNVEEDGFVNLSKAILIAAVIVSMSGCATQSYVDKRIAGLETRLDGQNERINELTETSRQALKRATDAGLLAQGKFLYTVALTDDGVNFDTDKSTLSDAARSRLTGLADNLKADNQNVYLEIQGHTDATGPAEYNQQLGLQRANAVRRYLHAQGLALNRMSTISYGETAPAATNSTAEGRAANRRVEIVVLK
jgi:outer membrane protein OmpA-like peptidoglycan-associated protein